MNVGSTELIGMLFGGLLAVVWQLAVVVLGVVIGWRWLHRPDGAAGQSAPALTPLDVLRHRFARGEIDEAEFDRRQRALAESERGA